MSKNLNTMKQVRKSKTLDDPIKCTHCNCGIFVIVFIQYLTSFLKEAEQEIEERIFEFEEEKLTLKVLDQATPGWTIDTLETPCTVSHK